MPGSWRKNIWTPCYTNSEPWPGETFSLPPRAVNSFLFPKTMMGESQPHDCAPPYGIAKFLRSGLNRPKSDFRNYTSFTNLLLFLKFSASFRPETGQGRPARIPAVNKGMLNLFNGRRGYAIGPIEEVGIVCRSSGDEEEVLLWAFQSWDCRFRVVLQLL